MPSTHRKCVPACAEFHGYFPREAWYCAPGYWFHIPTVWEYVYEWPHEKIYYFHSCDCGRHH